MLTLGYFPPPIAYFLGVLTVLLAAGVYLDGDRNDIVSWPWALAILIISPFILVLYIVFRIAYASSVNVWEDPRAKRRHEHDPKKLPSVWKNPPVRGIPRAPKKRQENPEKDRPDLR